MNIKLAATRINQIETTVFISFSGIKKDNFRVVDNATIINSFGDVGVIFHILNDTAAPIQYIGTDVISFKEDFRVNVDKIRVFYLNDSGFIADNITCFEDFLEKHGLDENVKQGDFECEYKLNKSIVFPRQSGNGGVIGITDLP